MLTTGGLMIGTVKPMQTYEYERRVAQHQTGWEATLTAKGDIRTFTKDGYTIHLHGKHTITLTGNGFTGELSAYQAAVKILELEGKQDG